MSDRRSIDCLLVGQTPPPFHGQAVVTGMLFEHDWKDVDVRLLRMAYSDSLDVVGRFSFSKVTHLLWLIFQTWKIAIIDRPRVMYYLPASPHKVPIVRDIIYLSCTRWMFSKTIFHYHAGGLAEYVDGLGLLGWMAKKVYGGGEVGIELSESGLSPARYFNAKRRAIIPNGLDVGGKQVKAIVDGRDFEILYVGGLVEGKGIGNLVDTAKLMKMAGMDVHFTVVGSWGDEGYGKMILEEVESLGLQEMITFKGVLTGDAKWEAFGSADCFFFPSHYASESFPLVLIEAMAYGLPLVTTDWRGIPNLVGESGAAYLLPIQSPDAYAEALGELMNNSVTYRNMSVAAKTYYEDHYTKKKFLQRIEQLFLDVSNNSKGECRA